MASAVVEVQTMGPLPSPEQVPLDAVAPENSTPAGADGNESCMTTGPGAGTVPLVVTVMVYVTVFPLTTPTFVMDTSGGGAGATVFVAHPRLLARLVSPGVPTLLPCVTVAQLVIVPPPGPPAPPTGTVSVMM